MREEKTVKSGLKKKPPTKKSAVKIIYMVAI